jgi:pimeloyl-ACP methyl ester carboxylesterase
MAVNDRHADVTVAEEALRFGDFSSLVGVLNAGGRAAGGTAVIVLNAGLVHHAGPHRLHVQLARRLAVAGLASLRFDFSGVGDSPPRPDHLPIFQMVEREPVEAMDALQQRGWQRFILAGICSGAYSAFKVARNDARVVGAVLINAQDFAVDGADVETYAWTRRYWSRSIFRPRAWLNLLSGRSNYQRLFGALRTQLGGGQREAAASMRGVQAELAELLASRRVALLFVASQDDVSREYLELLLGEQRIRSGGDGDRLQVCLVPRSDHLFTLLEGQRLLVEAVGAWAQRLTKMPAEDADAILTQDVNE